MTEIEQLQQELDQYADVVQRGVRLPNATLHQDPAYAAFLLGKLEDRVRELEGAIRSVASLPNWENRCGPWKDVREALRNAVEILGPAAKEVPEPYCGVPRSPRWPAVRAAFLRSSPECAACGTRRDLDVHHILPVSWPGGKELELASNNLITLCRVHHTWIGHLGWTASRNPDVVTDCVVWRTKISKRPHPPEDLS